MRECGEVLDEGQHGLRDVNLPVDLWQRAHPSRWRVGPMNRRIEIIVVHGSSGRGDARGLASMWTTAAKSGDDATSAHFAIGRDAYAIQCVHLDDIAQHAHTANRRSVGIEFCCRRAGTLGPTDPGELPTPVQLQKGASCIAWICRARGLDPSRTVIVGHAEADPDTTHTECPWGDGIDLDQLAASVRALMLP